MLFNFKIEQNSFEIDYCILKSKFEVFHYNQSMKKSIIAILLIALVASEAINLQCTNTPQPTQTCTSGCTNTGGSLPVNQQIIISTPQTIAPPTCSLPTVTVPVVNPPTVPTPVINAPCINVPTVQGPSVIAPPTIVPPTLVISPPVLPNIPNPSLPPQVPNPSWQPILPVLPVIALPPRPALNCNNQLLSNSFTLSFQYACRQGVTYQSCLADIVWNNVVIASIVPSDYSVHQISIVLTVQAGKNILQIEGAGFSDGYGLTIDNVQLVRQGTLDNIVVNGGFEVPNQFGSWSIYNDINGWQGTGIQIGRGTIYNSAWPSQVAELDGNSNYQITQTFTFDSLFHLVTGPAVASCSNPFPGSSLTYILEFDWAARTLGVTSLDTSRGNVLWNNIVIGSLVATTTGINHATFQVVLSSGDNLLQFDGAGASDGFGVSIDNVKLTSIYNSTNLIVNGNFQQPSLAANQFTYSNGGIPGWTAAKAEVGDCRLYNNLWASTQCLELDSDNNQRYTQVITISQLLYSTLVIAVKNYLGTSAIQQSTNLAINNAQVKVGTALVNINSAIQCQIAMTVSKFNQYLNQLYQCVNASVQHVQDNQLLTISQYNCGSNEWIKYFGQSGELDFSCDGYQEQTLAHHFCAIISIQGKVVHCRDDTGSQFHLQFSPCSHFEGQRGIPALGDKIFWKGSQSSAGPVYVMVATSCDC